MMMMMRQAFYHSAFATGHWQEILMSFSFSQFQQWQLHLNPGPKDDEASILPLRYSR